jgi:hypothetical protein
MTPVNWKGILLMVTIGVLFMLLAVLLISAGCTAPKGLKLVKKVPVTIPTPLPVVTATPTVIISQPTVQGPVVYESDETWMPRTNGRYLGENFGWRRDDVVGLQDMIVNISVYDYEMFDSYQWYSPGTAKYFYQRAPEGMKYLFVFIRMELEGTTSRNDPFTFAFTSKYYGAQYQGRLWPEDDQHKKGIEIKEMQTHQTVQGMQPFDYGWARLYKGNRDEYIFTDTISVGKSNAMDGYIIYVIPEGAGPDDVIITADFQGWGVAWWKLVSRN